MLHALDLGRIAAAWAALDEAAQGRSIRNDADHDRNHFGVGTSQAREVFI